MVSDMHDQNISREHADSPGNDAPWKKVVPTGPVLRPAEAAAYYGVSLSTYYELIKAGEVPPLIVSREVV